jgi:hypothetical protein
MRKLKTNYTKSKEIHDYLIKFNPDEIEVKMDEEKKETLNNIKEFMITLDKDMNNEDVEKIICLLEMIKGILTVKPVEKRFDSYMSYCQLGNEMNMSFAMSRK